MNSYQFEHIHVKSAKVMISPKGRLFIKAGSRIYLESVSDYSCLETGLTYVFGNNGKYVKRISNYITGI